MRFLLVLCLFALFAPWGNAEDCKAHNGAKCLPQSEAPKYWQHYYTTDPCFEMKDWGGWFCFTDFSKGQMFSCDCNSPPPPPKVCSEMTKDSNCPNANDYCQLGCDNTMCKYCGIGSDCNEVQDHVLTKAMKKELLDKHNELRAKVANGQQSGMPSATNMKKLKWDDELAKNAQLWADQCPSNPPHDPNRKTVKFGDKYVGQNKADSWNSQQTSDYELSKKTQAWYDEVKDCPASVVGSFDSKAGTGVIGHYTQVVWAETEYVGCGVIYYKDTNPNFAPYPWRKTLVCNYYPAGNYGGQPIYQTGNTASACTNGSENGLCL